MPPVASFWTVIFWAVILPISFDAVLLTGIDSIPFWYSKVPPIISFVATLPPSISSRWLLSIFICARFLPFAVYLAYPAWIDTAWSSPIPAYSVPPSAVWTCSSPNIAPALCCSTTSSFSTLSRSFDAPAQSSLASVDQPPPSLLSTSFSPTAITISGQSFVIWARVDSPVLFVLARVSLFILPRPKP